MLQSIPSPARSLAECRREVLEGSYDERIPAPRAIPRGDDEKENPPGPARLRCGGLFGLVER